MGEHYLKAFLGEDYSKEQHKIYMPLYGDAGGDLLEAASALGYQEVITYNRNAIQANYKDWYADEIINEYFSKTIALHRGDIVHFRLDYLTKEGATEELVKKIAESYIGVSSYDIKDIASLKDSHLRYTPKAKEDVVGKGNIKKAHGYPLQQLDDLVIKNYIGNPDINSPGELFEFSEDEIAKIKKAVKNEKTIHITICDDHFSWTYHRLLYWQGGGTPSTFGTRKTYHGCVECLLG